MEIIKIGKDLRSNRGLSALTTGLWAFGYLCATGPAGMIVSLAVSTAIYGSGYLYYNRPALFKKAVTQQQVEHAEQVNSYEPTTQKAIKRAFDDVVKRLDAKYHLQKPILLSIYHAFTTSRSNPTESDIVIRSGVKEGALEGYSLSDEKPHQLADNLAVRKVGSSYYEVQIGQNYIEFKRQFYRSHPSFSGKSKEEVTEMLAKALILRAFASHINERYEHRSFIDKNSFAQFMLAFYIAPSFIHNLLAIALPLAVISPLVAIIALNLTIYGIGYGISLYDSAVYRGHFYNNDEFVADNGCGEVLRDYYAATIDTSPASYSDSKPSAHERAENLHHYLHTQPPGPFIPKM